MPVKDTGLHLAASLPPWADDAGVSGKAAAAGVRCPPLSGFCFDPSNVRRGLVLGFGSTPPDAMARASAAVIAAVHTAAGARRRIRAPGWHVPG